MKLLLDTHIVLWALSDDPRLTPEHRKALEGEARLMVSAVSIWEISIKRTLGKLEAPANIADVIQSAGCQPLAITWAHADRAGRLPAHHNDPFDRLLIAQSQCEDIPVITEDKAFSAYDLALYEGQGTS